MGGGGSPAPPSPVAVPNAADQEAAEERARLYSMLRGRRTGSLAYGPVKRKSLLSTAPAAIKSLLGLGSTPVSGGGSGGMDSSGWGGGDGDEGGGGGSAAGVGGGYGNGMAGGGE